MKEQFLNALVEKHKSAIDCPLPKDVVNAFNRFLGILFPEFATVKISSREQLITEITQTKSDFKFLITKALKGNEDESTKIIKALFDNLEWFRNALDKDIWSMYQGDPAAKSLTEVVRTYPGFYAIAAYRISHFLDQLGVQLIPRIITENAHSLTGIDIHPSARIGESFCIDHGTGVVIGETTEIGNNVKLYQGVTLGALSVAKELASSKRHPTIGNNVVIYARTTILGGNTIIGDNSIIGGNVWLTKSLAPDSKVYYNIDHQTEKESVEKLILKNN